MSLAPNESLLLAKSHAFDQPPVTLRQHAEAVLAAALRLFAPETRWGQNWLRFFGLESPDQAIRFRRNLAVACLAHDLGKANEDFQAMVRRSGTHQVLRHEHLSTLLLHQPEIWSWLGTSSAIDPELVAAAVLAHHVQAAMSPDEGECEFAMPRNGTRLEVLGGHPDVRALLQRLGELAQSGGDPPELANEVWSSERGRWVEGRVRALRTHNSLRREMRRSAATRAMLMALKAALMAADAAGSALVREGANLGEWIDRHAHSAAIGSEEIRQVIIERRGAQIMARTGKPFVWHSFQEGAANIGDRGLLIAGCGAGKTMAAWRWAQEVASRHTIGKVVFLYPTRGTATEGFRDYVGWAPEADAELLTGTAGYELEGMQENPSEATRGKFYRAEGVERLFALGFWGKRFFSATVDQFLAYLENQYSALCMLPVLADAAVVIDEVHSFDGPMFGNLLAFLKNFQGPVLGMTATLPPVRLCDLLETGLRLYPDQAERQAMPDLLDSEGLPRYAISLRSGPDAAFEEAVRQFRAGRRVLWVANTVARCQQFADRFESSTGGSVLAYHSRYRLVDRQAAHQKTMAAFACGQGEPAIAVTTQVCEMSLDLDADCLITELAPVSSLVQRFGRANRHLRSDPDFRATLLVYPPENHRPYTSAELSAARQFVEALQDRPVSQTDLAEALERYSPREAQAREQGRFLSQAYGATAGSFRDEDGFTVPAVLDSDLEAIRQALRRRDPIDGYQLSLPAKQALPREQRPSWLPGYLQVASASHYHAHRGFVTP